MKTKLNSLFAISLAVLGFMSLNSCEQEPLYESQNKYAAVMDVANDGTSSMLSTNMQTAFVETASLSDSEISSLLKMKEEEKLASDIYSQLYEKWGSQVFSRINNAENNHLNAIVLLLEYYNIADSEVESTGIFSNPDIQKLYTELLAKGSESLEEAYKTGALIEEMDIADLSTVLSSTSNANITLVFENLQKGSRNHLRAFNRQISSLGSSYTPVFLSQSDFDQIVSSPLEKGKQYKMNGQGKGNGKGKGNGQGKGKGNGGNGNRGNGNCNQ